MIEYNYLLKRDEKDGVRTFVPVYPTTLDNLVCIEGKNSSGKSTLLHLLALGCYGLKSGIVNESLRKKIRTLIEGDHQQLEFKITITDKNGDTALSMQKAADSQDITVRDAKGKPLSSERFEREYRLIYDIPEDPVNRLPKLLDDIQRMQVSAGDKVRRLRDSCLRVLDEIEDARNPEKISQREAEIRAVKKKKTDDEAKLVGFRETLKEVTLFTSLKFYTLHSERVVQLKKDLAEAKKAGASKKKAKKEVDVELGALTKAIADETAVLDDLYHQVSVVLKDLYSKGKEKSHWELWNEIDVRQEIAAPDLRQGLKREGLHFLNLLYSEREKLAKLSGLEEARFLQELLDLLGRYEDSAVEIPGAELSVKGFVALLQDKLQQHEEVIARANRVNDSVEQLGGILEVRAGLAEKVSRARKLAAEEDCSEPDTETAGSYEADVIEQNLAKVEKWVEYYKRELEKLGFTTRDIRGLYSDIVLSNALKDLQPYSEKDLRDRITGLEEAIAQTITRLHKAEGNLDQLDKELRRLKKQEPHEYQDRVERLRQVVEVVQRMQAQLNQSEQFTQVLIDIQQHTKKPASSAGADLSRSSYYDHVSKYLGARVGEIQHVDGRYAVSKVDLIKREIHTVEGKRVKLDDMGTGQGQSAYLTALLGGYDGRRMIALIDEVAMMDSKSLGAVTGKLRELYDAGKVLVGVVVQKGDTPKVRGIE